MFHVHLHIHLQTSDMRLDTPRVSPVRPNSTAATDIAWELYIRLSGWPHRFWYRMYR